MSSVKDYRHRLKAANKNIYSQAAFQSIIAEVLVDILEKLEKADNPHSRDPDWGKIDPDGVKWMAEWKEQT